jgi:hypothetical protein
MSKNFNEHAFRQKVDKALTTIKKVLENTRSPQLAADVPHRYDDKYLLAESLTNAALSAQLNALEKLGLNEAGLKRLKRWAGDRSVTLRLCSEERCAFDREETRKVEGPKSVGKLETSTGFSAKGTSKVITTVHEFYWDFEVDYVLFAYRGSEAASEKHRVVLSQRHGATQIKTGVKESPWPEVSVVEPIEVSLTFLLQQIDHDKRALQFAIDRSSDAAVKTCRTPRRNSDVEAALRHFCDSKSWAQQVSRYLSGLMNKQKHEYNMAALEPSAIFVPIAPLLEEPDGRPAAASSSASSSAASSPSASALNIAVPDPSAGGDDAEDELQLLSVLSASDIGQFLAEQRRSFDEKSVALAKTFPADEQVATAAEANLVVALKHAEALSDAYVDGVNYIESMLRAQLIAAIGKVLSPVDFASYMRFHYRKLFKLAYQPKPFSYAVRRPDHCPEGTLSIESSLADGSVAEPIYSTVRASEAGATPMQFALSASTSVRFFGQRYLHAYVMNSFSGQSGQTLKLAARARQFSSFILLVGRIASAREFDPTAALIVQNKDDLSLPLMLETIPTPKEFADAIESLSPEQQAFAKAFRAMQLESTLFGVAIVQIKPQLERLLKLPDDALTKEIRLGQDLLELFIEYQLPSDLLGYDGPEGANPSAKVDVVKSYVANMKQMIDDQRQAEIKRVEEEARMRELELVKANQIQLESLRIESSSASYKRKKSRSPRMMQKSKAKKRSAPMMHRSAAPASAFSSASASSSAAAPVSSAAPALQQAAPATTTTTATAATTTVEAPAEDAAKVPSNEAALGDGGDGDDLIDFTKIPSELDSEFERLDEDSALRPTIIKPGTVWTKRSQASLLSDPSTTSLAADEQKREKNRAFDLLDALSRSGALPVYQAELHVVIASTHCFAKSLIDTVVQDNVNPIEKVERSMLIVAKTVQGDLPIEELIKPEQLDRVRQSSPMFFNRE